ncbi:PXA domain-containing protein [Cladochytrium replicatum]|nr:PXA domain-containing protein [Cladochytrium replicatum]
MLNLLIRDYISNWWDNLNVSKTTEFTDSVFTAIKSATVRLGYYGKNTNIPTTALPIFNTIVLHMREYKEFEATSLPLKTYLARNPSSSFHRHNNPVEIRTHLRDLARHIAERVLSPAHRANPVVSAFVREILATSVLEPLVEKVSDPDYVNQFIISALADQPPVEDFEGLEALDAASAAGTPVAPKARQASIAKAGTPDKKKPTKKGGNSPQSVYVKVVEARRLPMANATGFYCNILCGRENARTRKVKAESNPMWVEDFQFGFTVTPGSAAAGAAVNGVVIDIYDTRVLRDERIGSAFVPLSMLPPNKYRKDWFPLDTSDSKRFSDHDGAEIFLEMMHIVTDSDILEELMEDQDENVRPARIEDRRSNVSSIEQTTSSEITHVDASAKDEAELRRASIQSEPTTTTAQLASEPLRITPDKLLHTPSALHIFVEHIHSTGTDIPFASAISAVTSLLHRANANYDETFHEDALVICQSLFSNTALRDVLDGDVGAGWTAWIERRIEGLRSPEEAIEVLEGFALRFVAVLMKRFWSGFVSSPGYIGAWNELNKSAQQKVQPPATPKRPISLPASIDQSPSTSTSSDSPRRPPPMPPREAADVSVLPQQALPTPALSPADSLQLRENGDILPKLPLRSRIEVPRPSGLRRPESIVIEYAADTHARRNSADGPQLSPRRRPSSASLDSRLQLTLNRSPEMAGVEMQRERGSTEGQLPIDSDNGTPPPKPPRPPRRESPSRAMDADRLKDKISELRERIADTDRALEATLQSSALGLDEQLEDLMSTKLDLQGQIHQCMEQIADLEGADRDAIRMWSPSPPPAPEPLRRLDLHGIRVRVFDGTPEFNETDPSRAVYTETDFKGRIVFMLQVERIARDVMMVEDVGAAGWVVTRRYVDFVNAYEKLRKALPMTSRTGFPLRSRIPAPPPPHILKPEMAAANGLPLPNPREREAAMRSYSLAAKAREQLGNELERWANLLVSDPVAAETVALLELLHPEAEMSSSPVNPAAPQLSTAQSATRTVFGALRYTGSVLKKVAVSGVASIDAAISGGVPDRYPDSAGELELSNDSLESRRSIPGDRSRQLQQQMPRSSSLGANSLLGDESSAPLSQADVEHERSRTPSPSPSLRSIKSVSATLASTSESARQPTGTNGKLSASSASVTLSEAELEIIIECVFVTLEEVFDLSGGGTMDRWIRQKGLQTVKNLLRRTYGQTISTEIQSRIRSFMSESSVVSSISSFTDGMWPDGVYYTQPKSTTESKTTMVHDDGKIVCLTTSTTTTETRTVPPRTEEQKADDKARAKGLIVNNFPGAGSAQVIVGPHNVQSGLTRVFNMLQEKELNRHLVCMILDSIVKCVLSGGVELSVK